MTHLVVQPRPRVDPSPGAPLIVVAVAIACGLAASVIAQLSLKDQIVVAGALFLGVGMLLVRERALFVLVTMIASYQFLFHKSIGPIATDVSGGAPSIYITSIDALLLVLYAIWFLRGELQRDVRANLGRREFVVPAIGMLATVPSFLAAVNLDLAFAELVRMLWMYALYVYIALRVTNRRTLGFVVGTLFVIALVQFIVVGLQWRTGSSLGLSFLGEESTLGVRTLDTGEIPRPTGTVVHSDFLAALVGPIALLGYSLALGVDARRRLRFACLALVGIATAPLVIAQTRAALIGLAVGFVALTVYYIARGRLRWRFVIGGLALSAILCLVFWGDLQGRIFDNVATDQFQKEVQSRLELNAVSLAMTLDHPIAGVGLNNFERVIDDYDAYGLIFAGNPVHNLYLLILSETGVLGLVGFGATALLFAMLALRLMRSPDQFLSTIGTGTAAVYLFFATEEILTFSLRQDMPLALVWLLSGVVVAAHRLSTAPAAEVGR